MSSAPSFRPLVRCPSSASSSCSCVMTPASVKSSSNRIVLVMMLLSSGEDDAVALHLTPERRRAQPKNLGCLLFISLKALERLLDGRLLSAIDDRLERLTFIRCRPRARP